MEEVTKILPFNEAEKLQTEAGNGVQENRRT